MTAAMAVLVREIQRENSLAYFYSARGSFPYMHIFRTTICARERQLGECDREPLIGKAMIPKGKLNHPVVTVLASLFSSNIHLCSVALSPLLHGSGQGQSWPYINGITPDSECSFTNAQGASIHRTRAKQILFFQLFSPPECLWSLLQSLISICQF